MSIEFSVQETVKVQAKELRIYCKVCDNFTASLYSQDGAEICLQGDGYVPGFMPGQHFGDYLILNIDLETGQITNWDKPTAGELGEWVESCRELRPGGTK